MRRNGAQIITTLLERQGVETLAGIPGGASLPLYDALYDSPIRHVLARHEQGAGFVAQGIARITGRAGVCIATSGPGATNLLTAIADAKLDSIPLVCVTAQVSSSLIGTDAFQEVDTYSLTLPISKHNFAVRDAGELLKIVPEAFGIAESGRPGPVVIDVPKDVLLQTVEFAEWPQRSIPKRPGACSESDIATLAELIERAERPVLYIGGGVVASGASAELTALARRCSIPVASTLNALGAFPADDRLSLGMLGMHGSRRTNRVLDEADLLIALGARFDDRATGDPDEFCRRATRVHVDIDPAEIGKIVSIDLPIAGDVRRLLVDLLPRTRERNRSRWRARFAESVARSASPFGSHDSNEPEPDEPNESRDPVALIRDLARIAGPDAIVTTDVGQHQMWVAQHYPFMRPRRLLTSGGLGSMGFGLPAAIGAALAEPEARVICISGDGSILINIQELATLAELDLNVLVVVLNNGHLGLVRQQQELFYAQRYSASRLETRTDFVAVARGFGLRAARLTDPDCGLLRDAIAKRGPCLIDVPIAPGANVLPMVPPGAANRDAIGEETSDGVEHG